MDHVDATPRMQFDRAEYRPWLKLFWRPVLIAAAALMVLLLIIVAASQPAWFILGAGRGLVPEELYPVSGFLLVYGLTLGHAIVWAIGSAVVLYVMTLLGARPDRATTRSAMGVAYFALGPLPLLLFHLLYGGALLGMPRVGLSEWLAAEHPGARWLLIAAHPIIDFSLIPLGLVFLGLLWKYGERLERNLSFQTALALSLLATSLALSLSLAIHSILVHLRIG